MNELPSRFEEQVLNYPEYSYGVARIVVTLDDESECRDVFVAWGKEIVRVGSGEVVPFDPSRIIAIRRQ